MSSNSIQPSFSIKRLGENDLAAAVVICAEAMQDNPLHIRVFGQALPLRQRRLNRFFSGLLAYVYRKGTLYGAFFDGRLVAVLGMLPPRHCKPSAFDLLRLLPSLITSNSPVGIVRLAIWLGTWARIDPKLSHWHVGPLAVEPTWQKQGLGTQLLKLACTKGAGGALYLETDKQSNVELYKKFGFMVVGAPIILGQSSWVMMRPA